MVCDRWGTRDDVLILCTKTNYRTVDSTKNGKFIFSNEFEVSINKEPFPIVFKNPLLFFLFLRLRKTKGDLKEQSSESG